MEVVSLDFAYKDNTTTWYINNLCFIKNKFDVKAIYSLFDWYNEDIDWSFRYRHF